MKKSETEFGIEPESVNWQLPYMLKCHEFKNKRILVIHSYECAYMASINNSVVYVTDDKEKYNKFVDNVINSIQFGNDDCALLIKSNQWLDLYDIINDYLEKNNMPKFDVAIMNPPYDGSLHLEIMEHVIPNSKEVIDISPVRWLQDPLAKLKSNSDYRKYEETISKKIDSCEIIKSEVANKLFNISFGDLGIYKISNGGFKYDFAQNNSLVNKFISKNDITFMDVATKEGYRGKYKSNYFGIINSHYGDTSAWISDNFELFTTKRETNTNKVLFFNNDKEVKNCFNFLNLKAMRYFANIIRINQRVPWQFVPYLDYTKSWDDKRFCEYFGITGYISDTEAEQNSEWETILNTMKEYK